MSAITLIDALKLIGVGFLAGVINTLAGGGSLLTLPMLIFLGLPPTVANGTNRIAVFFQNLVSSFGFKSKGINTFPFSIYLGISSMVGAFLGALIATYWVTDKMFTKILGFVMVLAVIFTIFNWKDKPQKIAERLDKKHSIISVVIFFFIGIYAGFIQTGTSFMVFGVLASVNHFSLIKCASTKAIVVVFITLASIAIFSYYNLINYTYGAILAIGNASAGWFTSRWAVKKGNKVVKIMLIIMILVMAFKLWFPKLFIF